MSNHSGNPILPSFEYIPDPEVHVFGDRVYIYGSHDEFNGKMYCDNDYVTWSAPINDLSEWQYEGVIYKKSDHHSPIRKGKTNMYAPDVSKGPDGKFYLYYSIADSSIISVAKSEEPVGPFTYYGDVMDKSGKVFGEKPSDYFEFDPAILVDGDRVYLYSGSGQKANEKNGHPVVGLFIRELEKDMLTAKNEPDILLPADDDRNKPNFFEAASVRKFAEWYYLLYMSSDLTGLHYMMSRYPDREFVYKGPLYSTSTNSINDGTSTDDAHVIENNHGSIEEINRQYYIFNHRHTNQSHFSRQMVGDVLKMNSDGTFRITPYTSQGLNGEPFKELKSYPSIMVCGLINKRNPMNLPFITQEGEQEEKDIYGLIKNINSGSRLIYRYFDLPNANLLELTLRGEMKGEISILLKGENGYLIETTYPLDYNKKSWEKVPLKLDKMVDVFELSLHFEGDVNLDMKELEFK